jgi:NAD-dependent SIR2 family protein deacetylase
VLFGDVSPHIDPQPMAFISGTAGASPAPDFRHFVGIYHWVKAQTTDYGDYVVFRKYLKTLSGVYRWHFVSFQHPSARKSLHETIKIEVHCEHCGSVAKVLIDRLIEANLWAV